MLKQKNTHAFIMLTVCHLILSMTVGGTASAQQSIFQPTVLSDFTENCDFTTCRGYGFSGLTDLDNDGYLDGIGVASTYGICRLCEASHSLFWVINEQGKSALGRETRIEENVESGNSIVFDRKTFGGNNVYREHDTTDVNGDGYADIVIALSNNVSNNVFPIPPTEPRISVFFNNGSAPYFGSEVPVISTTRSTRQVEIADVDNDGVKDIIGLNSGVVWYRNEGTSSAFGPFSSPRQIVEDYVGFTTGDVDDDGDIDIAVNGRTTSQGDTVPARLLINNGRGEFTNRSFSDGRVMTDINITDLNGDDLVDILANELFMVGPTEAERAVYLLNSGSPGFFDSAPSNGFGFTGRYGRCDMTVGDFDGQNGPDVIEKCENLGFDEQRRLYLNSGLAEPFTENDYIELDSYGHLVGDIDNDDDIDLVGGNTLWLNNGFSGLPMPVISASSERALESANAVDVTFTLNEAQNSVVSTQFGTVPGTAKQGEDYYGVFEIVEFQPGETERSVRIPLIDDDIVEEPETIFGRLAFADGANVSSRLIEVVVDSDEQIVPGIEIGATRANEVDGVLEFPVTLDAASPRPVSVGIATQNRDGDGFATPGVDFYGKFEVLTIPPGETQATFKVVILRDDEQEPDENVEVRMFRPENAAIVTATAVGAIESYELPIVSIQIESPFNVNENDRFHSFYVSLNKRPTEPVSVRIASQAIDATQGQDYFGLFEVLEFDETNYRTGILLTILDDTEIEPSESFRVRLFSPSEGLELDPEKSTLTVVIEDDD